jgi:hypothetical protein
MDFVVVGLWELTDGVLTTVYVQIVIHPACRTLNPRLPHQNALQYCRLVRVCRIPDGSDGLLEGA